MLGIMEKMMSSWSKLLAGISQRSRASGWQVAYLASLKAAVRFSGLRIFQSLDSKRDFDDNESLLTVLPFLYPSFLFERLTRFDAAGPVKTLLEFAKFLMLIRPLHELGFSEAQLLMIHDCARKYSAC